MNKLITIYINGCWDADHTDATDTSPVRIFEKGTVVQVIASQYDQYIEDLEERGYDCYLCPDMYANPKWNGEIIFIN